MKIEKGIIGYNNRTEMIVRLPGHIYHLNNESFFRQSLKENDKVIGVIINNRFSICREYISTKGVFLHGFITKQSPFNEIRVQIIENLNKSCFSQNDFEYNLGEVVTVEIS